MRPTEEQIDKIGEEALAAFLHDGKGRITVSYGSSRTDAIGRMGRAAFEASCKIALAEPTNAEFNEAWESSWIGQVPADFIGRTREMFANRLRSLTEPEKDEAVEALKDELIRYGSLANMPDTLHKEAVRFAAIVRSADKKAGKQ